MKLRHRWKNFKIKLEKLLCKEISIWVLIGLILLFGMGLLAHRYGIIKKMEEDTKSSPTIETMESISK